MIYPPLDRDFVLPNITLVNDRGETSMLWESIRSHADITLLIPGFVSCHGVCPRLAQLYKGLLSQARKTNHGAPTVSALFFSFDPQDTPATLLGFRERMGLEGWHIAQANPADTQKLLSSLQFTVMNTGNGFQHPAQAFVFTKDLHWVGSLYGTDVGIDELLTILDQAHFQNEHPVLSSTIDYLSSPNSIAIGGGAGLLIALALLLWLAVRLKPVSPKV